MTEDYNSTIDLAEAAKMFGHGVTRENVQARIRRGSLYAEQNERGEWRIPLDEIRRVLDEIESCENCGTPATSYVVVKYHHHNRLEFALCEDCAVKAEAAYSKKGGVLEVIGYPLLGEGWKKP